MSDYHGYQYGDDWTGWKRALTTTTQPSLPTCTPPHQWTDEDGITWHPKLGHVAECPKCSAIWRYGPHDYQWHFIKFGTRETA